MKQILNIAVSALLLLPFGGCSDDYLNTAPATDIAAPLAFETTEIAAMTVNGLARIMGSPAVVGYYTQDICGAEASIKLNYGCYPGNAMTALGTTNYGISANKAAGNYHDDNSATLTSFPWWYYYRLIGNANSVIMNIDGAVGPDSEKQRMKAQALTFRAYAYTMLLQIYGYRWTDSNNGATPGVVLRLEPTTGEIPLSTMADVYRQIYQDLDEAVGLFQTSGWTRQKTGDTDDEFWLPNVNVAYATYARAALNKLDYAKAVEMAQKAREGYPLMTVDEYKSGFNTPNREWIFGTYFDAQQHQQWSSWHSYLGYNAYAATSSSSGPKRISKDYLDKIPATDIRKAFFFDPAGYPESAFDPNNGRVIIDRQHPQGRVIADSLRIQFPALDAISAFPDAHFCTYMQFKVSAVSGPGVGCLNHFRSSEMYLIEAEAQYKSNNETRARELLVQLTKDSGRNPAYTCTKTGADLFEEIKFTAQIELWGEGFDWFMTKRWGDRIIHKSFADGGNFLAIYSGDFGPEEKNKQTWVIPLLETDYNPLAKGL
jgi:hypothetical protein